MKQEIISIATDWFIFAATISAGVITAITTMCAVIYTNKKTIRQLNDQKIQYEKEKQEQNKMDKMVVIKPLLMLKSFTGLLDMLIVQNIWDRFLLFSGDDGFEFYDNIEKRGWQQCRILLIENNSKNGIQSIKLTTESILVNLSNDEKTIYKTENFACFLRNKEDIVIRILNQIQFEKIIQMNQDKTPNELDFICTVEYSTLAKQRIRYLYKINIKNDQRIEIIKDEIENIADITESIDISPSIFRNLQDSISGVDRPGYSWEKMGSSQMRGALSQYKLNDFQQKVDSNIDQDTVTNKDK